MEMASSASPSDHVTTPTATPSSAGNGSNSNSMHTPSSATRRPPRKSTLTQQQKNQKRQRATQDQLLTLEIEFEKNPTPTAVVRERIANDINMTERSVQIWFQNRRAKIKNLVKKSIENGEDSNEIPESMRRYLAMQAMESGKPLGREMIGRGYGFSGSGMLMNAETNSSKVVIHHFACRSLGIGSWRRVGQSAMDLVIFYSPEKCCVTYYINNDSAGYKIEYPFAYIKNVTLDNGDPLSNAEGASQRSGGLVVELNRPPNFFMDSSGSGGFYQCGDFTEDQQASQVLVHHLGGHPKVLSGQLAKLVALESFQNRHLNMMYDPNTLAVSAPVSPIQHRPASQPNHHVSHNPISMFHDTPFGVGVGLHPPRGHKRQRSRSVPIAIDFSMLRGPMPSFLQPPEPARSPFVPHPDIVAPIPQYHHQAQQMQQNVAIPLSIDTSTPFQMDFRQYPMSATTAPSPSDYGTPAFFSSGPGQDTIAASNMGTPYGLPFMSPLPEQPGGPQMSNQQMNVSDPVIANQSPPLTSMGVANDSDLYQMGGDGTGMGDDGLSLQMAEWDSKQPMTLPFRGPGMEEHQHQGEVPMINFGTIDPANLSNGGM